MTNMIPFFEVVAFTNRLFAGNPAGVCLLEENGNWLPDDVLQRIAAENNLAETAFVIPREKNKYFDIRWMSPMVEIDLCGHATLASAHVLFRHLGYSETMVRFQSSTDELTVVRDGERLVLDFPARPGTEIGNPP